MHTRTDIIQRSKKYLLEVEGPFACFTRPEFKVERVSYDVITPSAARGIFDAILWHPAMRWNIRRIEVMKPIKWTNLRRNEVTKRASKDTNGIDITQCRTQRASLVLQDVKYRILADFTWLPINMRKVRQRNDLDDTLEKYESWFVRRATKGQCFSRPYLGTREFACEFRLITDPASESENPIQKSCDLGWMLYDKDYRKWETLNPMMFRAQMNNGVINIPAINSKEIFQ